MLRAVTTFMLLASIVVAVAVAVPRVTIWGYEPGSDVLGLVLTIVVLPALVMWGVLELLQIIRPRRVFKGERRATGPIIAWGFVVTFLAIVISGLGMSWLDRMLPDALIFCGASAVAVIALFPALSRFRRGRCAYCNYDQRGATVRSGGTCTECGKAQPV